MTKLNFDYSILSNNISSSITGSVDYLRNCTNQANFLDVPGDFRYYSDLKNLSAFFSQKCNELNGIKSWIANSNKNYDAVLNELEIELNHIVDEDFKMRQRMVR